MSPPDLSNNDSSVLSALFDPEASLSRNASIEDTLPSGVTLENLKYLQLCERDALHPINGESPSVEEIETSISKLTGIIDKNPCYASAYANRAQARRMLFRDEQLPSQPAAVQQILQDLSRAIKIGTPEDSTQPLSSSHAKVLASAHTHRGYLLLLASKSDANRQMLNCTPGLETLCPNQLEEAASREFALGGRYGNDAAKQIAVRTNPYAKLCGSIVKEALRKEISDYYQPQVSTI
ncbi:uncharacterized protein A1O9_04552 [Exophiala aquamarina CBS 119918]|uniref:Uncharacterized protein n=1 Tax=Exophiala aquamarina CBS 119918 TaxID=1182545 RepID=A0A072PIL2_9EURO|nr:uncharacterized protein A1O9_04552 [Exophiala aquamarina CBS 119918]KEF59706.1 hypothetical protein A1O9_04552 [Exophiala aquamarina CBS 119918]